MAASVEWLAVLPVASVIRITLILAGAWLAAWFVRRRAPLRHAILLTALAAALLTPVATVVSHRLLPVLWQIEMASPQMTAAAGGADPITPTVARSTHTPAYGGPPVGRPPSMRRLRRRPPRRHARRAWTRGLTGPRDGVTLLP